ncbi:hypothetical protein NA57DRAFT_76237 [Rhizodiscina lignyota]|uniref:Zn(2)-C6 fungal-type domain-containing protein n=1 Tax=Rhizodiscina lignyota TaxID=1504668 RepID=A0A9P4IGT0_9PEZI|nr:hypothetical protein NA57DRAFT_76237 [Rhizodiscina lignyota]
MTQLFKCETCRARKIKCDESRPTCRACSLAGRVCSYRTKDPSVFAVEPTTTVKGVQDSLEEVVRNILTSQESSTSLQLRSARISDGGQGVFQTFKPKNRSKHTTRKAPDLPVGTKLYKATQGPRPKNALSSTESRLISRWGAVMGNDEPVSNPLSIFGSSIHMIPSRIGTDPVLDLAVQYFVHSGEMHRLGRNIAGNPAHATGEKALKALRHAMSTREVDGHMLLAVKLHFVAELLVHMGTWYYVIHILGISQLIRTRITRGSFEELDYALVQASYFENVTESLLSGRDCVLDGFLPMEAIRKWPSSSTPLHLAASALLEHAIKVPRLVRLVRACVANPSQAPLVAETIRLAEELYFNDTSLLVEKALVGVYLAPTRTPKIFDCFPQSYHGFPSIEAFTLSIRYHAIRVLLCGALQRLLSLNISSSRFDRGLIEQQDIDSAAVLGMSVDYALTVKQAIPLVTLRMVTPLQWSIGSWHRLQGREPHGDLGARRLAMLNWCMDITNSILRLWKAPTNTPALMVLKVEAISGGPIVKGVAKDIDWLSRYEYGA